MTDLEFQQLVAEAVSAVGEETIARRFTLSLPGVRRWATGKTSPHPAMRERIGIGLRTLLQHAKEGTMTGKENYGPSVSRGQLDRTTQVEGTGQPGSTIFGKALTSPQTADSAERGVANPTADTLISEDFKGELAALRRIAQAAEELHYSGYDGDWIGDVCEPLYSALADWQSTRIKGRTQKP